MLVSTILQGKGEAVHTILPTASIGDAVARLDSLGIGALVVSNDGRNVLGILSERDIVQGLARNGETLLGDPVSSLMTARVISCRRDDTGHDLLATMTESRVRHVPVVEDGALCGIVSIGDVVKSRLDEITYEANALREYIAHS